MKFRVTIGGWIARAMLCQVLAMIIVIDRFFNFGIRLGEDLSFSSPRPSLPPAPLPQLHTPLAPKARVWSAPQETRRTGSRVIIGVGIGKKNRSFSGAPIRSQAPNPNLPFPA